MSITDSAAPALVADRCLEKERKEAKAKAESQKERRREETEERAKMARAPGKAQTRANPCGKKDLERKARTMTKVAKDPRPFERSAYQVSHRGP